MKASLPALLAFVIAAWLSLGPACAARADAGQATVGPAPDVAPVDISGVTEDAIQKAIDRGVDFLYSKMNANGVWDDPPRQPVTKPGRPALPPQPQRRGYTVLVLNALAAAGHEKDPQFVKAFDWLMQQRSTPEDGWSTYTIGLRLQLLASLRLGTKYREQGNNDIAILMRTRGDTYGLWAYRPRPVPVRPVVVPKGVPPKPPAPPAVIPPDGDFSNTNYAVLGLWGAMDERFEISPSPWEGLEKLYVRSQYPDGSWNYLPYPYYAQTMLRNTPGAQLTGLGSMTTAAIASLYLILDYTHSGGGLGSYRSCEAYKSLGKGLDWLAKNFNATKNPGDPRMGDYFTGYYFYNCERVGTAGGHKYFGKHNWYPEIAATILRTQAADGSVELACGEPMNTAFAVLFLARGGGTVMMNKLQHSGDWDNRFREVAGAVDWLSRTFERSGTWQVVTLPDDVAEITDSRILFISGAKALVFTPAEQDKLRRYVQMGGLLVFNADGNSQVFHDSAVKALEHIWPGLEVTDVDVKAHPLGNMYAQLNDPSMKMEKLATPTRVLAVILGGDPPAAWERRAWLNKLSSFTVAANLYTFATDKTPTADQPRRLSTFGKIFSAPLPACTRGTITLARINYGPSPYHWDPEPLAWERFGRLLAQREGVKLDVKAVTPQELSASGAKIAHLAGWDAINLPQEQSAAIIEWIKSGGTLIVEQAGGRGHDHPFDASFRRAVGTWFPKGSLKSIERAGGDWKQLGEPIVYRNVEHLPKHKMRAELDVVMLGDRPAIIYSPYDIQTGLLALPNPITSGPDADGAYQLVSQMLLRLSGIGATGAAAERSPATTTSAPGATTAPAAATTMPATASAPAGQ
jgi:hypothetical protein